MLDGRPTQHGQHLSIGRDKFTLHTRFRQRFDPRFASFGQPLNDVVHGSFGQLHLGIPQKLIERRVGVGEETAVVQGEDGVVGVVEDASVPFLTRFQFFLRHFGLSNITTHRHGAKNSIFLVPQQCHGQIHRKHIAIQSLSHGFSGEVGVGVDMVSNAFSLCLGRHKIPELVLVRISTKLQPKLHSKGLVVLGQRTLLVERHNHINGRLNNASVEKFRIGEPQLGGFVPLDFFLQKVVRLLS